MSTVVIYWPIIFFVGAIITALFLKIQLFLALILVFLVVMIYARSKGLPIKQLIHAIKRGIKSVSSVIQLLSLIMMVIPIWMLIGTIPTLLVIGFETLQEQNLILVAFVLSAVLSMTIGTAMGTMSILMSSFLALGGSASLPLPLIVGAVVSGAYIGDRSALMSGSVHLNASVTQTNAKENFTYMFRTLTPAIMIGLFLFFTLGNLYAASSDTAQNFSQSSTLLQAQFSITWLALTPIALMIGLLLLFKLKMKTTLLLTLIYSFCLLLIQGIGISNGLTSVLIGNETVLKNGLMLRSSGFWGILPVLLVILFSTLVNELFDELNLIKPLLDKYLASTRSFVPLSFKVGLLSLLVSVVTCSQTLMIVICGQHVGPYYDKLHYSRKDLMLTIADYGIITVPLIPWNINGQLIEAMTGIPTTSYFQFTFICLLMPLMNILYSVIRNRFYTTKLT